MPNKKNESANQKQGADYTKVDMLLSEVIGKFATSKRCLADGDLEEGKKILFFA